MCWSVDEAGCVASAVRERHTTSAASPARSPGVSLSGGSRLPQFYLFFTAFIECVFLCELCLCLLEDSMWSDII